MKREDFEHVLRAAVTIVEDEIMVVGSQAVLADHPDAPAELLVSMEVDLYPRSQPERAIEIDGAIGDGSQFFVTYGYYAHGVGPETVAAPAGWEGRTTRLEFGASGKKAVAHCMSTADLALAKLAAGRAGHDIPWVEAAVRHGLVDLETLRLGIPLLPEQASWDPSRNPRAIAAEGLESIAARLNRQPATTRVGRPRAREP